MKILQSLIKNTLRVRYGEGETKENESEKSYCDTVLLSLKMFLITSCRTKCNRE